MNSENTRQLKISGSSNRSFGFVFTIFFSLVALFPLLHKKPVLIESLILSGLFGFIALTKPSLLAPLNQLWTKFGVILGRIVSPIALGILYAIVFIPGGLLFRLFGKDSLKLTINKQASSYWIPRMPLGPDPKTMKRQF